jgi:hypothetical protein
MKIEKYELSNAEGLQELKIPAQARPLKVGLEDTTLYLYALTLLEDEAVNSMEKNTSVDQLVFLATVGAEAVNVPITAGNQQSVFLGEAGGKWAFHLGPKPKPPTV